MNPMSFPGILFWHQETELIIKLQACMGAASPAFPLLQCGLLKLGIRLPEIEGKFLCLPLCDCAVHLISLNYSFLICDWKW